jgi:hypothetical protein
MLASNGEPSRGEPSFPMIRFDDGGMKSTGAATGNVRLVQSGGSDR